MATNRWDEIEALINDSKAELKAATNHVVLKDFAADNGLLNKGDFGKYKHLLKKFGIDYDALRTETFAAQDAQRATELDDLDDAAQVYLWSAALDEDGQGSFALVDSEHEARWYGKFFDDDRLWTPGDLVTAEQSAADKAVWLASKAFETAGEEVGELVLTTTCPHLDTAALKARGVRLGVKVTVEVDDSDERAVMMAQTPGWRNWKDTDLSTLVDKED